jgi:hypothetical protein
MAPQKVNFAIQIKSGIFPGEVIIVEHGKHQPTLSSLADRDLTIL